MKNEIFDNMLSRYDLTTEQHKRNAIFEVNQQVILAGLYAGGFFESAPFFSELDSLMKETGGFNDLHLHLNGATETDVLWQHILMDSYNISKNVHDTLKRWPLAKEQAEQEEANFSGIVMYRRLKKASFLRRKIVEILFGYEVPKHDGHPMLFYLGMRPCSTDKFSYEMIHCLSLTAEAYVPPRDETFVLRQK